MKARFPGFPKYMAMMRRHDPQIQEDGFHWLLPHAGEHVHELIAEFGKEEDFGLQCWLLELIASARSPEAFTFLAGQLRSNDWQFRNRGIQGLKDLGTKEARALLWQARSFPFASPEETKAYRSALDTTLNQQA
jgi:hypothetical protein